MMKPRDKEITRQLVESIDNASTFEEKRTEQERIEGAATDREVERQIAALKAISDMEVEHLLTELRLIRSNFSDDQLQIPVMQFFEENLSNVSVVKSSEGVDSFDLRWKDEDGNLSTYNTDGRNMSASLFHHLSMAYPASSVARQSLGGLQFSARTVRHDVVLDDLQMGNYMSQDSANLMLGMPDGLQTPGAYSQRLSVGMTPKTVRIPKHGEMLLSVHGSPLGVYQEDNMEAIQESGEG